MSQPRGASVEEPQARQQLGDVIPSNARTPRESISRMQELLNRSRSIQTAASPSGRSSAASPFTPGPSTPTNVRETLQRSVELGKRVQRRHQSRNSFDGEQARNGRNLPAEAEHEGDDGREGGDQDEAGKEGADEQQEEEEDQEPLLTMLRPTNCMQLDPFRLKRDKAAPRFPEHGSGAQPRAEIAGYDDALAANRQHFRMLADDTFETEVRLLVRTSGYGTTVLLTRLGFA